MKSKSRKSSFQETYIPDSKPISTKSEFLVTLSRKKNMLLLKKNIIEFIFLKIYNKRS